MIPLGDESRRTMGFPAVTAGIIAVNAIGFVLELVYGDAFIAEWSLVPKEVASGHHLITIFSALFMHGSWSHIVGNMIFLWAFGPQMEEAMGGIRYLAFYLFGGVAAFVVQIVVDPSATLPNLGASGAIAAVMGGFMVTFPRDRIRTLLFFGWFARVTFIPAALLIGFWFLTQLLSVGVVGEEQSGGVAYMAHIGGLIFGALTARLFEEFPSRTEMFGRN